MTNIEQTETLDYFQQINEHKNQITINTCLLEGTIFSLLKTYPDVFKYNEYYTFKNGKCQFIFENGQMIGEGAYGRVYKIQNPNNNQLAALKVQQNCKFEEVIYLAEEFKIQKNIEKFYPECIIQVQSKICINQTKNNRYGIYAYLDLGLGNLREYQSKLKIFTDQHFTNLFDCILDGIMKIHSLKIAHGDIKLDNIINTEKKGWVLADFGCAIQYQTFYGNYPIVGTKAYMKKEIRNALNENKKMFKMNLFQKDIYAFQLVLLQILYPNDSISNLQQILDQQILVHPKINLLYNKDYQTVKYRFQQIKFNRISLLQESIIETKPQITNLKLTVLSSGSNFPYTYKMIHLFEQTFKCVLEENLEPDAFFRYEFLQNFYKNYCPQISCQEIFEQISFEELTKPDYDLYYDIFGKKGQKLFQLMLCQRYQALQKEINCNLQLQEAELFYIFDEWDQAKKIINSINDVYKFENHELLLKFLSLKSRLNNQWIEKGQEIIPYLKNYKDPFYLLIDWKFILMDSMWLNKSTANFNIIYVTEGNLKELIPNFEQIQEYYVMRCLDACHKIDHCHNSCSQHSSLIKNMKEMDYDNYTIFYWCWERCILENYSDSYQDLIQEFIEFIEQNMENYYFNWIIYDLYAQFLIYTKKYDLANQYLQKAYQIIQNDCINNQFTVQLHLFQMQFLKNDSEYYGTYIKILNLLNQMIDPEIVKILFKSIHVGLGTEPNFQQRIFDLTYYVDRSFQGLQQENKIQKFIYSQKQQFNTLEIFTYVKTNKFLFELTLDQLFTVADYQIQDQQLHELRQFFKNDDLIRLLSKQIQQLKISYFLELNKNNSIQQVVDPTPQLWYYQLQSTQMGNFLEFFYSNIGWLGDFFKLPK